MQVILPTEQVQEIQSLIANLLQHEISHFKEDLGLDSPYLNKVQTCQYLGISNNTFDIMQTPDQLVFTYIDTKGNVNSPLHVDYLNNKMNSVRRRHPRLKHATPHKLRHTGATLAKQAGTSLEAISEALTHSDTITTKTYVNTSNVIPMAVGEIAYRNLKK